MQWWFKKFYKGDKCLEDEECSSWPSEVDIDRLRAIIEADPLKTTWQVAEELNVDHSAVIWHLRQSGKVKKFKRCLMRWPKIKKIIVLKCCLLLIYPTTMNHFSDCNAQPHVTQPMLQKLNELGYKVLPHPPYSPDFSLTDYHVFKHLNNFLQGKCFHNQQRQKMPSNSSLNPKTQISSTGIKKLTSHWKNICWL